MFSVLCQNIYRLQNYWFCELRYCDLRYFNFWKQAVSYILSYFHDENIFKTPDTLQPLPVKQDGWTLGVHVACITYYIKVSVFF